MNLSVTLLSALLSLRPFSALSRAKKWNAVVMGLASILLFCGAGAVNAQSGASAAAASAAAGSREQTLAKKQAEDAADAKVRQEMMDDARRPLDPSATLVLHDGDPILLHVVTELNSKTAKRGDPVPMVLAEDLKVGDVVVAKAGFRAMGEVVWVTKAGFMGSPGSVELRLDYLRVGERKVWLRGSQDKQAKNGGRQAAAAVGFLTVGVGFFIRGKDMVVTPELPIKAYIGDDVTLPPLDTALSASVPPPYAR